MSLVQVVAERVEAMRSFIKGPQKSSDIPGAVRTLKSLLHFFSLYWINVTDSAGFEHQRRLESRQSVDRTLSDWSSYCTASCICGPCLAHSLYHCNITLVSWPEIVLSVWSDFQAVG